MSDTDTPEKRVGWAELFFDLVFVFAVTEVSSLLAADHGWAGLLRALVVFVPVYWVWVGTAVQTNRRDAAQVRVRLSIFAIALTGLLMALALPEAYGDRGLLFAGAYWAGRAVLAVGGLVRVQGRVVVHLNPYVVSVGVTGPLLVVGALLHGDPRELVWGAAALLDLSTPSLLRSRLRGIHYDAAHLAERFGLFVLIALGESVVAIGASAESSGGVLVVLAVVAAFALACGLWWVYFHFAADAMRHSLATARVQLDITRLVLSYGHLAFIGAIIAVAVGLEEAVAHPAEHLPAAAAALLVGGTALYLATFGFTRWAMFRLLSRTRLTGAALCLLVLLLAPVAPALVVLVVLAVVLAVLNAWEIQHVADIGWRARLAARRTHKDAKDLPR